MKEKPPLLQAIGLKKYFKVSSGYLHAVDDINISIASGETLGIVGESGCGKSTLGRTILRLLEPTSGDILYNGESFIGYNRRQMNRMRRNMQIIFQDPYSSINPRMSVAEIIAEYMIVNKTFNTRAGIFNEAVRLMDTVGLDRRFANMYPHELDGGRRQRIGVARALSLNPKFIVCDEPVSALDVSVQAQILNLLMDLQEEYGLTYMFITHDLSVVRHISNNILVMYMGMFVEQAPAKALFENPVHPYTRALLAAIPEPDISARNKAIKIIRGEVASPVNPRPGCRFAVRCEYATEVCSRENPDITDLGADHTVACFHCK